MQSPSTHTSREGGKGVPAAGSFHVRAFLFLLHFRVAAAVTDVVCYGTAKIKREGGSVSNEGTLLVDSSSIYVWTLT